MEKLIKSILEQYENEMASELIRTLFYYLEHKEIKTDNKDVFINFDIVIKKEADRLIKQRERKRKQRKRGKQNGK